MTATAEQSRVDLYPTRSAGTASVQPRQDKVVWGSAESGPMDAATLAGFEEKGYLNIEELISPDEVKAYRRSWIGSPPIRRSAPTSARSSSHEPGSPVRLRGAPDQRGLREARPTIRGWWAGPGRSWAPTSTSTSPGSTSSRASRAQEFCWHSDFETWHAEDGLPRMRTVSVSIALTENYSTTNGGADDHAGIAPDVPRLRGRDAGGQLQAVAADAGRRHPVRRGAHSRLADAHGIELFNGKAGSATWFDCNCMHGSSDNITPYPRSNVFIVFNSVENTAVEPFAAEPAPGLHRRPGLHPGRPVAPACRYRTDGK